MRRKFPNFFKFPHDSNLKIAGYDFTLNVNPNVHAIYRLNVPPRVLSRFLGLLTPGPYSACSLFFGSRKREAPPDLSPKEGAKLLRLSL